MDTFAEGIESIRLACSLVIVIPSLGVVLLDSHRVRLVSLWVAVSIIVAWLRFTGWWGLAASGPVYTGAGICLFGIGLGLGAKALRTPAPDPDRDSYPVLATTASTVLAATIATWAWVPCVGSQLGDILNQARSDPWAQLGPTALFMVGLNVVPVVLAALAVAAPAGARVLDRAGVRFVGALVLGMVGGLVTATLYDDLAGELARRSSW